MKKGKRDTEYRIATWNIKSLKNKEMELVDEFEKAKLDVLAITETKKREQV